MWSNAVEPGFPGVLGLRHHSPEAPPDVIKVLRSTVYFTSSVQMCEQGFLEPLEYILEVPNHLRKSQSVFL